MTASEPPVGALLRGWRERRRLSQHALALEASVSQRHLSFIESGRAQPSREMVLHLADQLELPLRARNRLLLAAGFAPLFAERTLDDPALAAVREAVERVLAAQVPYPALAVDRRWTLVAANAAVPPLLAAVDPALLEPPVNVLRLTLHPAGLAPRIVNLPEWRAHLLARLHRQVEGAADPALAALHEELAAYPAPPAHTGADDARPSDPTPPLRGRSAGARPAAPTSPAPVADDAVFVPLRLRTPAGTLSLISTTTVFGTPLDVTVSELALECFYPADAATGERLRAIVGGG